MRLSWGGIRQVTADGIEELATSRGKNDLAFYLISRFIAVLLAVIVVESAVAWLASVTFLPPLQSLASNYAGGPLETMSVISLLQGAFSFVRGILGSGFMAISGFASRSVVIGLVVGMLLLLAIPIVVGALAFSSMVVGKVNALQEQRERGLAQIEHQRSQFVTDIAHDLRTPIMAISGISHALVDGLIRDDAQQAEYLQAICDKADKMGTLVNAVFDYTKLGSGSFELSRSVIDLSQLVLREAATAYADAEGAAMRLTTCISDKRCPVLADEVQLSRVVANLIANAIKHSPAGTEVCVLLVRQAQAAFVMVADTGVPITGNPDDLFQPFAQDDAARTHRQGGSGLGLSICKRIANMHGFSLSIAQPYGRFTKAFVLQCPLCE